MAGEEAGFRHLFSPISVGSLTLRNRIVLCALQTLYAENNLPSDQHIQYYRARAAGGIGLIITESYMVHPTSQQDRDCVLAFDPATVEAFRRVSSAVHAEGAAIIAQLLHVGMHSKNTYNMRETWAPSAVSTSRRLQIPHVVSHEQIEEVVAGFVTSARVMQDAGYDGVELHAAHGYLLAEFLSPLFNKRTDEFGGSLENRMRLLERVVDGIRDVCGREFVLGVRLSIDEDIVGGLVAEDTVEIVKRLDEGGQVDFVDATIGVQAAVARMIPSAYLPQGYLRHRGAAVKRAVPRMPVLSDGRIVRPAMAEEMIANGETDLVGMSRAVVADPELPAKALRGDPDAIRPCIGCNECFSRRWTFSFMSCTVNPATGREVALGNGTPAAASARRVVVVGGGPAGLEAARVAAERGHEVTLLEAAERLGGQVLVSSLVDSRHEALGFVQWQERAARSAGVTVMTGTAGSARALADGGWDAVIVATGSRPRRIGPSAARPDLEEIPGVRQAHVLTMPEVLEGMRPVGHRVVIIDEENGHASSSVAEWLSARGHDLTVITPFATSFLRTESTLTMPFVYANVLGAGGRLMTHASVTAIGGSWVEAVDVFTGRHSRLDADTVVIAIGDDVRDELWSQLRELKPAFGVRAAGDVVAPRTVMDAVYEGRMAGLSV
jgi:2,4-dienoyl-CoA reductase-like NADH-dependent reductase (Old Yellow Enzyme family)/thioredoxin reductase